MSLPFMQHFEYCIDWYALSSTSRQIDEAIVCRQRSKLNWVNLCFVGTSITRKVVDTCVSFINWHLLSKYGANPLLFTDEFMCTYRRYIDFASLPGHVFMTLESIEFWANNINWAEVSAAKLQYPTWFIKKYFCLFVSLLRYCLC